VSGEGFSELHSVRIYGSTSKGQRKSCTCVPSMWQQICYYILRLARLYVVINRFELLVYRLGLNEAPCTRWKWNGSGTSPDIGSLENWAIGAARTVVSEILHNFLMYYFSSICLSLVVALQTIVQIDKVYLLDCHSVNYLMHLLMSKLLPLLSAQNILEPIEQNLRL
jgi:hypothetical protein